MITRNTLQCLTCGQKTITRSAVGNSDYQEFAFPCPKCGIEISYGMQLHLNTRMRELMAKGVPFREAITQLRGIKTLEYVNIKNANQSREEPDLPVRTFDEKTLNPVPQQDFISPFIATAFLPKNSKQFNLHQQIRENAATRFWPQVRNLLTHLERQQWDLFDRQLQQLELGGSSDSVANRVNAAFNAIETWEQVFAPGTDKAKEMVRMRIALGRATSRPLMKDFVEFFKAKGRDETLYRELVSIRERWAKHYGCLSSIYLRFYWDDSKNKLESYIIAEKQFDDLKLLYVESFETFCRISAIAAGIEGIIHKGKIGVPLAKRLMGLDEFEGMANGSKPAILKQLKVADLFVPFIDNKLRNGIGHHAAHYEVVTDSIGYRVENDKGIQDLRISYTGFCEKLVTLYRQLHVVSLYAHWLRQSALGGL